MTIAVRINNQNQQRVRTMTPIVSTAPTRLVDLTDVSVIDASNNSTIVFNTVTNKYEIKQNPLLSIIFNQANAAYNAANTAESDALAFAIALG